MKPKNYHINKQEVEKIASKLEQYMESKLTLKQREALSSLLSERKPLSDKYGTTDFFKKTIIPTTDDLSNLAEAVQNKAAPQVPEWEFKVWNFKF